MIVKLVVANSMIILMLLGVTWKQSDWINVFIKVWLVLSAIASLVALMRLEGYIVKLGG